MRFALNAPPYGLRRASLQPEPNRGQNKQTLEEGQTKARKHRRETKSKGLGKTRKGVKSMT